ncbi:MAG TPA: ferredoxin family protein [Caulobacteraceae bacterium]|jgi:NAD-dependent dihydropyrimidine dehydrogenase PreA subunit
MSREGAADPPEGPSRRTVAAKVRQAAADLQRPGAACKAPGAFAPVVDRRRCEGKGECVQVCPYDVFDVGRIREADYRALPLMARLKVRAHGMQTAYTPRSDLCMGCGLCVVACPEDAIRLSERPLASEG